MLQWISILRFDSGRIVCWSSRVRMSQILMIPLISIVAANGCPGNCVMSWIGSLWPVMRVNSGSLTILSVDQTKTSFSLPADNIKFP